MQVGERRTGQEVKIIVIDVVVGSFSEQEAENSELDLLFDERVRL